jgi:hypothetical protein
MLALYHLASAKNPEKLPGLADMFKDVGVAMLPMRSKPVVFVSEAMIGILEQAAPCVILLDEVVAYARNLEGVPIFVKSRRFWVTTNWIMSRIGLCPVAL